MTQEHKELLLKDLCARLPYKVYAQIPDEYGGHTSAIESIDIDGFVKDFEGSLTEIENIKPYLLPLSSMTDGEKLMYEGLMIGTDNNISYILDVIDWLNAHHFDYRGLIEKGLAIDATSWRCGTKKL